MNENCVLFSLDVFVKLLRLVYLYIKADCPYKVIIVNSVRYKRFWLTHRTNNNNNNKQYL